MRMTVLASGSKGNSTVIASADTRLLVDAGLSCRELLKRMKLANEDPAALDAILITHEHQDHIAGLATLARRLRIPVYLTEPTHRAWVRMVTPRTTMTYAQWLDHSKKKNSGCPMIAKPQAKLSWEQSLPRHRTRAPHTSPLRCGERHHGSPGIRRIRS